MTKPRHDIVALMGLVLVGCVSNPSEPPVSGSPVVDLAEVQVGDSVLGLEVARVDASTMEAGETVGTVAFKGEITVTGTYANQPLAEATAPTPCFYVIEESAAQLPQVEGDTRIPWFCFTNGEVAQSALGDRIDDPVTIVIDQYTVNYIPSDVTNGAEFIRVAAP
jgi:hypothetical protein